MTRDKLLAAYKEGKRNFGSAYLGGANLVGADLRGADLRGADLRGAYLGGAYLGGADLRGAYLGGADLGSAYLGGADLRGAYLRGADLGNQWIIQGPTSQDGYFFFLQKLTSDAEPMIKAGCRHFTIAQAREHWQTTRVNTPLGAERLAFVDFLEWTARNRGLISPPAAGE